jgi:DNA-binding transcriptional MerR regulator
MNRANKEIKAAGDLLNDGKAYTIGGKRIILYPIGTLATECGKSPVTLRKWEADGQLPKAPFRDGSNRRMYAKEHIALIKKLVADENLTSGVHFKKTNFAKKALEGFKKLTLDKLEAHVTEDVTEEKEKP